MKASSYLYASAIIFGVTIALSPNSLAGKLLGYAALTGAIGFIKWVYETS